MIFVKKFDNQEEFKMHVTLICGKLCSGKTTYAHQLRRERHAVLLSCDEITLALTGLDCGAAFDGIAARTQAYLYDKAAEIAGDDIPVILDWGFWTKESRAAARSFFDARGIPYTFVYLDVPEDVHRARIAKRNAAVEAGELLAYYVDEGLARKFEEKFEIPEKWEIDTWITT